MPVGVPRNAMRLRLLPIAIAAALLGAAAAPAQASKTQESVFQDDRLLLFSGDDVRRQALDQMAALGADTIHSLVFWGKIAPGSDSTRRPDGFDASDPAAYPAWDPYDALVREAAARGLDVIFTPTGPAPAWASQCGGSVARRKTCNPDPDEFASFVTAVGKRYSGTYADENGATANAAQLPALGLEPAGASAAAAAALPRVDRWSIWNEPDLPGWLYPQQSRSARRLVYSAARRYRGLFAAASGALGSSGHGGDQILLGETAPVGRRRGSLAKRSTPPVDFYRALFCLDDRGRPLRGANATANGCSGFAGLTASGVSHHPYTAGAGRPPRSRVNAGDVTISTLARLARVLDQAAAQGRFRRRAPIYFTEFGFQTQPPDPIFGVSPARQAEYINESDWLAFRTPRVRSVAQYELVDDPNVATFNTGLRFANGRAKPALAAYRLPIWVTRAGSASVRVFGQARGHEGVEVEIQNKRSSHADFETVARVTTAAKGYFLARLSRRPGNWRLRFVSGGQTLVSRETKAERR
jgi:hypothetical protein